MVFVALGLNHKTAPLFVREKVARMSACDSPFLQNLLNLSFVSEALVLSTCNRTEIYCAIDIRTHGTSDLLLWLSEQGEFNPEELLPYVYQYEGAEAVKHLLRVASGLDSMMLGEPQILGQLKQAFRVAYDTQGIKQELGRIIPFVFKASKQIRTQSGIGNNPISVASAAVRLISDIFSDFSSLKVLIIGSGETAGLVAKYLYQQGARDFTIASRTRENADRLALKWHAEVLSITDIPKQLPHADVVISATACPLPFIDSSMLLQSIGQQKERPLFFLDLAVPRDISPDVTSFDYVHLYNIDDLHLTIEKGLGERRDAAVRAEELITPQVEEYMRTHRMRYATQAICDYRDQMYHLTQSELARATQKIESGEVSAKEVLQELSQRLLNKLTHATTVGLKHAAADDRRELVDLAHYLLNFAIPRTQHEKIT